MWGCGSGRRIERRSEATRGGEKLRSKEMWVQSNKKEWKAKQRRKEKMKNIGGESKLRVVWDEGKQRSDWARRRSGEWSICYWRIQIRLRTLCTCTCTCTCRVMMNTLFCSSYIHISSILHYIFCFSVSRVCTCAVAIQSMGAPTQSNALDLDRVSA